jgi:hypothetical protein
MNTPDSPITRKMRDQQGLETALNDGVEDALRRHVQAGVPVVVWRDGKVVELAPDVALAEHLRHKQATKSGTAA